MGEILNAFQMVTLAPGWLELPAAYAESALAKGAGHKYIKRVPKAGGGYRYFYHVGHGGGVHSEAHFVEGASFRHEGGHYHIAKVDGDKLTITHDETKESKSVTKAELGTMLAEHHAAGLKAAHDKARQALNDARDNKASPKQIARLEARAKAAGVAHEGDESSKHFDAADRAADEGDHAKADAHRLKGWEAEHERFKRAGDMKSAQMAKRNADNLRGAAKPAAPERKEPAKDGPSQASSRSAEVKAAVDALRKKMSEKYADAFASEPEWAQKQLTKKDAAEAERAFGSVVSAALSDKNVDDLAREIDRKFKGWRARRAVMAAIGAAIPDVNRVKELVAARDDEIAESLSKTAGMSQPERFNPNSYSRDISDAHSRGVTFATDDTTRPSLMGTYVRGGRLYASDGHRAVSIPTTHRDERFDSSGKRSFEENAPIDRAFTTNMPKIFAEFDAKSLLKAAKAVLSAQKARGAGVNVAKLSNNGLGDHSRAGGTVDVPRYGSVSGVIGVNPEYIIDALKGAKGTVKVGTSDGFSPIHIEREDGEHHLIMPMRL